MKVYVFTLGIIVHITALMASVRYNLSDFNSIKKHTPFLTVEAAPIERVAAGDDAVWDLSQQSKAGIPAAIVKTLYDTHYFRNALGLTDYGFKPLGVEYGSSTGKLTGLFNGSGYEVYYYNPWGLECQRVASGFNVGRRTTKYNFDLSVSEVHTTYDGLYPDRDVYYSYDDCGRRTQMLVTEHRTRDGVAYTDSATIKYEYGPTGLMEAVVMGPSRKKITYDIHGWQLKAETELKRSYNGNYVERLYYADTKAAHPRYNGFVSRKEWKKHAYDYEYDPNGFLTDATYSELPGNDQATGANQGVKFDRSVSFDYDLRGNVTMIRRKGAVDRHPSGRLTFGLLDDIEATYTGNRLTGYSAYSPWTLDASFGGSRVSGITELYDRKENLSASLTDVLDDRFAIDYKLRHDAAGRLTGDTSRGVKDAQYDNNGYLTEVTVGGCSVKYRRDGFGNLLRAEYSTPDGSGTNVKGDMSDRTVLYDGDGHVSVNGVLEMSRFEGGYFDADGKPHYYLTDYQGNVVRVIDETKLGGQPMDYYPYGEPWVEWNWAMADTYPNFIKNRFLYGGKERITQFGLGLYNFEARMYRAPLGRFSTPDKKDIDTPWLSPFAYCACNPVNAIDPDGNVVIFINGMHNGFEGAKAKYWNGLDTRVMNQIGDHHAMYYDGASGGLINWISSTNSTRNTYSENRYREGYNCGYADSGKIMSSLTDNESIKIVTHSMGAAFGKGMISGLLQFGADNGIDMRALIEIEVDLAPYQPTEQKAVPGIPTITISHAGDWLAGSRPIEGAYNHETRQGMNKNLDEHSVDSFTQKEIDAYIPSSERNKKRIPYK